jgi:hypothetical protein
METSPRRSFLSRALAFIGVALTSAKLVVTEVDAKTNTMTAEPVERWSEHRMAEALGRLSNLLPSDYVMAPRDPMTLAEDIHAKIKHERGEAERLEVSLAGVSVAAHGGTGEPVVAHREDWAWHPAYQDTVDLRRKFDAALALLRERIPAGQQIAIHPCGCVVIGDLPRGEMLPLKCNAIAHERGVTSIVIGPIKEIRTAT